MKVICLYKKIVQWKLSGIVLCVALVLYHLKKQIYQSRIVSGVHNKISLNLSCDLFIMTALSLFIIMVYSTILQEYKKRNKDMIFWTAISNTEEMVLWMMCLIPWLAIGNQIVDFILRMINGYSRKELLLWNVIVYLTCAAMIICDIDAAVFRRRKSDRSWELKNPFLDLVSITISERIRNIKYIIMQVTLLILGIGCCLFPQGQVRTIYYCVIVLLMLGIEDFFWLEKSNSFSFYRICGITFYRFYGVELVAVLFLIGIPISLIGCFSLSLEQLSGVIFLSVIIIFMYWECIYIYLGLLLEGSFGGRNVMCYLFLIGMCLPVVNIGIFFYVLRKAEGMWNLNDIY